MADEFKKPTALTKCVDCGCCYADLYADGEPICWACDAGEVCAGKKRAALKQPGAAAAAPAIPKQQAKPKAAPIQEARVAVLSKRGMTSTRISEEIRAAIRAADPTIKHAELARQYGISDVSVYGIRKAAGIVRVKDGAKPGKEPKAAVAKTAAIVRREPEEILEAETTVSIHLRFTPEQLDSAWSGLSVASKAVAIAAALQAGI